MAKSSVFEFTNTSDGTHSVTQKALQLCEAYALVDEDPTNSVLSNVTAPVDAEEIVTFRSRRIPTVKTDLNIQNPAPTKSGVQYQVQVEDTLVTTDTVDASFRVDEPIVALLTIRHPRSGNITEEHIATVFTRLVSCLMKEDGTWRFGDLMRGAQRPIAD